MHEGLPWWLSSKESTCQCSRHRFDPWGWKIPHATMQLSLCWAQEPQLWSPSALEPMLCNSRSHHSQTKQKQKGTRGLGCLSPWLWCWYHMSLHRSRLFKLHTLSMCSFLIYKLYLNKTVFFLNQNIIYMTSSSR